MDIPRLSIDTDFSIEAPQSWHQLDLESLSGTIMVIGRTDSGKSTFVRWLVQQLCSKGRRVGWLDADVGQSTLGLPATLNLAMVSAPFTDLPDPDAIFFLGSASPARHMLPTLVGARLLQEQAYQWGADLVVADTTGLVEQAVGGGALKEWKIALLKPATVVAIEQQVELAHILDPLRLESTIHLHTFPVAESLLTRSREERRARRSSLFQKYFSGAADQKIDCRSLPIYGKDLAAPNRLLAFQDEAGFVQDLGVLRDMHDHHMHIATPLADFDTVHSIRIGELRVDPVTGEELT